MTRPRMMSSEKSKEILSEEYEKIFRSLVKNGFLEVENERYSISKTAVLNEDSQELSSPLGKFSWAFKESRGGLLYLINAPEIARNIKTVYFPTSGNFPR